MLSNHIDLEMLWYIEMLREIQFHGADVIHSLKLHARPRISGFADQKFQYRLAARRTWQVIKMTTMQQLGMSISHLDTFVVWPLNPQLMASSIDALGSGV